MSLATDINVSHKISCWNSCWSLLEISYPHMRDLWIAYHIYMYVYSSRSSRVCGLCGKV